MKKLLNMGYLTAMLIAFGAWSGQAAADDVLTAGGDVTDAAFAAGAVEADVPADERAISASATASGDGVALALDVDAGDSVIFADSDSTTNQKTKQKIDVDTDGGNFSSTTGNIDNNQFSNNRFSIGLFNTGDNVTLGASMNVNVIFTQ